MPLSDQPDFFQSTSSVGDFPVRIYPLQAAASDLPAPGPGYGPKSPVLLANYDPASCSWRTSQRSLFEGWEPFSATWPRSGMMRNGTAFQLPPLVPLTAATESGYWPTPVATDTNALSFATGRLSISGARYVKFAQTGHKYGLCLTHTVWIVDLGGIDRDLVTGGTVDPVSLAKHLDRANAIYQSGLGLPLNPTWTDWLMGYPINWTDCDA